MKHIHRFFRRCIFIGVVFIMLASNLIFQKSAFAATVGPYGFTGTVTHTFQMDQTATGDGITDTYHDEGTIVQTVAADGSATVTMSMHATEVIDSLVECYLGATLIGSYDRHDVITTDGSGTGTLPAGSVSVMSSGDSYFLHTGLTYDTDHVNAVSTRVISFTGGSGDCLPPDGQTITSEYSTLIKHDDSAIITLTNQDPPTFTGSVSHVDEYNPTQTIGMSWDLRVADSCGEALGKQWVSRYPMPYTNEAEALAQLKTSFRSKVTAFIAALRKAGAKVKVTVTYRPQARAYLMANAWAIAKKGKDPKTVKPYPGVDSTGKAVKSDGEKVNICWLAKDSNGTYSKSLTVQKANEMVQEYKITGTAGYPSQHMYRTAIDMTITWGKAPLKIQQGTILPKGAKRKTVSIATGKHDSTNPVLWEVGATYGVIKGPPGKNKAGVDMRIDDKVHWSVNGK
jgi:hypothetical protein